VLNTWRAQREEREDKDGGEHRGRREKTRMVGSLMALVKNSMVMDLPFDEEWEEVTAA
jgi:hypothetical protein